VTGRNGATVGTVSATTTSYYTVSHAQNYSEYIGTFFAKFDLFEPDGSCRITPDDKEIEVIVIYGPNERHAVYKISDLPGGAKG
jgi:hypothetical protein